MLNPNEFMHRMNSEHPMFSGGSAPAVLCERRRLRHRPGGTGVADRVDEDGGVSLSPPMAAGMMPPIRPVPGEGTLRLGIFAVLCLPDRAGLGRRKNAKAFASVAALMSAWSEGWRNQSRANLFYFRTHCGSSHVPK